MALSQLGNVGGRPYWSWYGFESRVDWCACFVSWCANECGYLDTGVIPRFASCSIGLQWFRERGLWRDRSYEPRPGDLIFFVGTYDTPGVSHVGIYVGGGKMLHCGDPIQYADINTNYWQSHFYAFGRPPYN